MTKISVGICCFNEEQNVPHILSVMTHESLPDEIVVIASGCTDRTVEIARSFSGVTVLEQEKREGKASAINLFLQESKGDYLILESADTIPLPGAIRKLIEPLEDETVGATTGRPKLLNNGDSLIDFTTNLLWDLHHLFNLRVAKLSEAIAFKRVFRLVPKRTKVDDACIETAIRAQGYRIRYVPDAIFINKGPQTVADFVAQRRRVHLGLRYLKDDVGFVPVTTRAWETLKLLVGRGYLLRSPVGTVSAMALEAWCRWLARGDYKRGVGRDDGSWEMVGSSKELIEA